MREIIQEASRFKQFVDAHTDPYRVYDIHNNFCGKFAIHLNRKYFLEQKQENEWITAIEPWENGSVEEYVNINGIRIFSLLDKSEFELKHEVTVRGCADAREVV